MFGKEKLEEEIVTLKGDMEKIETFYKKEIVQIKEDLKETKDLLKIKTEENVLLAQQLEKRKTTEDSLKEELLIIVKAFNTSLEKEKELEKRSEGLTRLIDILAVSAKEMESKINLAKWDMTKHLPVHTLPLFNRIIGIAKQLQENTDEIKNIC